MVFDDRGRVLLQLRIWPAGWEPPGGHVGREEDPAETVVRETLEENGLEIEVERLTGYYRFTGLRRDTDAVFRARAVGGQLRKSKEARRLVWADPDRLPSSIFPWYRQRIADALRPVGSGPQDRVQHVGLGTVGRHGLALLSDLGASILPSRPGNPSG